MTALLVMVGGALGAVVRYQLERWSVHRFHERVPYGTALANLAGALVLALATGWAAHDVIPEWLLVLLGTGFCGSLTTFSGFMGQVDNRLRHAATRSLAVQYLLWVTLTGIALAAMGLALTA